MNFSHKEYTILVDTLRSRLRAVQKAEEFALRKIDAHECARISAIAGYGEAGPPAGAVTLAAYYEKKREKAGAIVRRLNEEMGALYDLLKRIEEEPR